MKMLFQEENRFPETFPSYFRMWMMEHGSEGEDVISSISRVKVCLCVCILDYTANIQDSVYL